MKTLLLTLLLSFVALTSTAQIDKTIYSEINAGVCIGTIPMFPGASSLVGVTNRYQSGIILDYQGGIAFPTLLTGKVGVGIAVDHNMDLTFGVRVLPSTMYAQLLVSRPNKKADLVFTTEALTWSGTSFGQYSILTVGWRFNKDNKLFGWKNKLNK